jgi:hypothetical protein
MRSMRLRRLAGLENWSGRHHLVDVALELPGDDVRAKIRQPFSLARYHAIT